MKEEIKDCTEVMESPYGPPSPIVSVRNHIYLYSEIDDTIARATVTGLYQLALTMMSDAVDGGYIIPPIVLHINSYGGDVTSAFSIINAIEDLKAGRITSINNIPIPITVETIIDGEADSCASLIACVGSKRKITKHSVSLLHEVRLLSGGGKVEDIDDQKTNLQLLKEKVKNIYLNHSKLKEKELDNLLKPETYSTPEELLKFGLVDEII